ncbi:3-hydroxyacyl-ACP dehydratase [Pseudodesulfovibrio thermohalotolerans]|uniref:3-hydroxyacyl-ACP dehydratase n=1 Tax=Pseudodesulfovibrio thermohalotolerans TaxID=2880651 RepID=UPI002442A826|nr:3-hydroxyacyl-ACP dehydratase [Pseudodesulfovibrio thermohalotolerans]WFS63852.1 3-hydroxyacyl-ACP dehydratase [Pseudodesulfovibrio thermohalotolerans]
MLLVDILVASEQGTGCVETTLPGDGPAAGEGGTISPLVFVELLAQTYAAIRGWELAAAGLPIPEGYLVGVQRFVVLGRARGGEKLVVDVETVGEFEGFYVVEGRISQGGDVVATGNVKLWIPPGAR